jgi:putative transposase
MLKMADMLSIGIIQQFPEADHKNREIALIDVADYIVTFYNRTRQHSHLGGTSPEQFEAAHKARRRGVH